MISECLNHFGHQDFDKTRAAQRSWTRCPLTDCVAQLLPVPYRKDTLPYCPVHGIRLHTGTFVYWNGPDREDKRQARLRNFRFRPDLAEAVVTGKAETYRLGYELSEDALTWNVFVGLAEVSALRAVVRALTGIETDREPRLYLWGRLVDLRGGQPELFEPLDKVRDKLEKGIRNYRTEPDVMLVNDRYVICIEAKFTSGNTLAHDAPTKREEKPTSVEGLVSRYLDNSGEATRRSIDLDMIGERFHSQLFRNIVFASEMAGKADWRVVNLVSETQWRKRGNASVKCSFRNPVADVQRYLASAHREKFAHETWEALYRRVVFHDNRLGRLDEYLRSKSAGFERAFDLN